jgi:LuxR family transcriptional regulator, maltose regulon positive regulatory protein
LVRSYTLRSTPPIAKVSSPRIRNVIPRHRLFELLDSCREYPVTWISAPAGSGKTSLVASYLADRKLNNLWYQVDVRDNDQATFFYYMGLAAAKAAPRTKRSLPYLTPEYALGIPIFTLRYFEDLYCRLKLPFVIVFDDYQHVPDESAFHERICQELGIIPHGIRTIIVSRNDPPLSYARLRTNEQLHLIEPSTINFTSDETQAYVSLRGLATFSDGFTSRFYDLTQGWAAGLVLLTENVRLNITGNVTPSLLPTQQIFPYFAREIFTRLDDDTRGILMATAIFPAMTGTMVENLTGRRRSREILERLCRSHFFVQQDMQPNPFYRYHPLFREFLLSELREHSTQEHITSLLNNGAIILEEAGLIEDAADLILSVFAWGRMESFLRVHGHGFINQGRERIMEDWFDRIPDEIINVSGWLLFWKGHSLGFKNIRESEKLFTKAYGLFEAKRDRLGAVLSCAGVMKCITTLMDDFSSLGLWIERLDVLLKEDIIFNPPELEIMVALSMSASLGWYCPYRSRDIEKWYEIALRLSREAGCESSEMTVLAFAASYYYAMRDPEKSAINACQALEFATRTQNRTMAFLPRITNMAVRAILGESQESVLSQTYEILEFTHKNGIYLYDGYIISTGLTTALMVRDLPAAAELLPQLEKVTNVQSERAIAMYRCQAALYHHYKGDQSRALAILNDLPEASPKWDSFLPRSVSQLRAGILWALGDREGAWHMLSLFKNAAADFDELSYPSYTSNLMEARYCIEEGNTEEGLHYLSKALFIGKMKGFDRMFSEMRSQVLADLFAKALTHNIEVEYVRKLIRERNLFPDEPPLDIPNWPWPIKVFTLGRFELLIDDKPVEMTRLRRK